MSFVSVDNSGGLLHNGGQMAWDVVSPGHIVMATITADYKMLVQEINFSGGNTVIGKASFVKQLSGWTGSVELVHFRPRIVSLSDGKILVLAPATYASNPTISSSTPAISLPTGTPTGRALLESQSSLAIAPLRYSFISMERDSAGNYKITGSIDLDTAEVSGNTTRGFVSTFNPLELFSKSASSVEFRRNSITYSTANTAAYFKKITITLLDGVVTGGTTLDTDASATISNGSVLYDVRTVLDRSGNPVKIYTVGPRGSNSYLGYTTPLYLSNQWYAEAYPSGVVASRADVGGAVGMGSYIGPGSYAPMEKTGVDCFVICGNSDGANQAVNNNYSSSGHLIYTALDTAWVTSAVVCILTCPTSTAYGHTLDADITAAIRGKTYGSVIPLSLSFREIAGAGTYVGTTDPIPTPYYAEQFKNVGNIIHRIDDTHFWLVGCFKADADSDSKLGVITVSI